MMTKLNGPQRSSFYLFVFNLEIVLGICEIYVLHVSWFFLLFPINYYIDNVTDIELVRCYFAYESNIIYVYAVFNDIFAVLKTRPKVNQ